MQTDPDVLDRLLAALDGLARALSSGRADEVLAAEAPLADAAAALGAANRNVLGRRSDLRMMLTNLRLAVGRCQALGASAAALALVVSPVEYGPSGRPGAASAPAPPR